MDVKCEAWGGTGQGRAGRVRVKPKDKAEVKGDYSGGRKYVQVISYSEEWYSRHYILKLFPYQSSW